MNGLCERCGEPNASHRHIWMDNELEHKMYYVTIRLCDKCAWSLRDRVRDSVKAFMDSRTAFMDSKTWNALRDHQPTPEEVKALDERWTPKGKPE